MKELLRRLDGIAAALGLAFAPVKHLKRFGQAIAAIALLFGTIVLPASAAHATTQGGNQWIPQGQTGYGAGIYVTPDVNSPKNGSWGGGNATDIHANSGSSVSADCWGIGGYIPGFSSTWYHISGVYYGDGRSTHSFAGWVYAPFFDNEAAINQGLGQCRYLGEKWANYGSNHIGEYACASPSCAKNSGDVLPISSSSYAFADCYIRSDGIAGYGNLWIHAQGQYNSVTGIYTPNSAWMYASFMGYGNDAGTLPHCAVGDYTTS
ncbi:hypothetical protein ABIA33_000542 [Streptacidiphilus sp. MAP12-16]|uniref:hypothetical protein n=1 Tax=Streptacidiphilus sp. MAP12-16 TaxID=3156300 RepID=UPI0035189B3C